MASCLCFCFFSGEKTKKYYKLFSVKESDSFLTVGCSGALKMQYMCLTRMGLFSSMSNYLSKMFWKNSETSNPFLLRKL